MRTLSRLHQISRPELDEYLYETPSSLSSRLWRRKLQSFVLHLVTIHWTLAPKPRPSIAIVVSPPTRVSEAPRDTFLSRPRLFPADQTHCSIQANEQCYVGTGLDPHGFRPLSEQQRAVSLHTAREISSVGIARHWLIQQSSVILWLAQLNCWHLIRSLASSRPGSSMAARCTVAPRLQRLQQRPQLNETNAKYLLAHRQLHGYLKFQSGSPSLPL